MKIKCGRSLNFIGFLICAGLVGFAVYLQYVNNLEPCPLCTLQRLVFTALGVWFLIGVLPFSGRGLRIFHGLITFLIASAGIAVAGRQVWLQHLPADQIPACGPGLNYLLEALPPFEVLQMVFKGSGECAEVDWTFLHLSIAEWSLLMFIILGLFGLLSLRAKK